MVERLNNAFAQSDEIMQEEHKDDSWDERISNSSQSTDVSSVYRQRNPLPNFS